MLLNLEELLHTASVLVVISTSHRWSRIGFLSLITYALRIPVLASILAVLVLMLDIQLIAFAKHCSPFFVLLLVSHTCNLKGLD